jgi:hypothetical protein
VAVAVAKGEGADGGARGGTGCTPLHAPKLVSRSPSPSIYLRRHASTRVAAALGQCSVTLPRASLHTPPYASHICALGFLHPRLPHAPSHTPTTARAPTSEAIVCTKRSIWRSFAAIPGRGLPSALVTPSATRYDAAGATALAFFRSWRAGAAPLAATWQEWNGSLDSESRWCARNGCARMLPGRARELRLDLARSVDRIPLVHRAPASA